MSALIEDIEVTCPYCGERLELDVDCTVGNQIYYEDCQVCCVPVVVEVTVDDAGDLAGIRAHRDDD